jgi:GTP-binding protein
MIIRSADFILSAVQPKHYPKPELPEFAFIGRSNVGKSSLINMLTGKKVLAKISNKPGKTRTLNFFCINGSWNIVDMPGYGYAKISKTEREQFVKSINSYLKVRQSLLWLFILIDSRHKPLSQDIEFIQYIAKMKIPFVLVFTKTDKPGKTELDSNIASYRKKLLELFVELPPLFFISSVTREGREELLGFLDEQATQYADEVRKLVT